MNREDRRAILQRKMIKDKTQIMGNYSIKNIEDIIEHLVKLQSQGWTHIETNEESDYLDGTTFSIAATRTREENDTEYNKRIKQEKDNKEIRRSQYEKLKKEFENE